MAQVYTTQIAAGLIPPGVNTVFFTVPAVNVWIARDLVVTTDGAVPASVQLFVASGTRSFYLYRNTSIEPGEFIHLELRQVLLAGAQLRVFSDVANVYFALTGYSLSN